MVAHARYMRGDGAVTVPRLSLGRSLFALADREWAGLPAAHSPAPLTARAWWPQTQLLTARETEGHVDGLFVSVKGGHNGESHNHNDIGTVLVAVDGHPALVDAGVAQYTRQHFGPRRYEIWTMRSDYHNVPNVDGHEQLPGNEFCARDVMAELGTIGSTYDWTSPAPTRRRPGWCTGGGGWRSNAGRRHTFAGTTSGSWTTTRTR